MQPSPLKVLVVDDCPIMRCAAQRLLTRRGHQPTIVSSLTEARAQLKQFKFDLVLSDFDLGNNETGYQVLDLTRALQSPPTFVLMSSWLERDIDPDGVHLDGVAFIHKPFNPTLFQQTIADAACGEERLAS
ncbi:MAG: hypothetical protein CMH57_02250 [Myxococcales bacterium]|nr:hypothetical protein [Myxococcales bacterium]